MEERRRLRVRVDLGVYSVSEGSESLATGSSSRSASASASASKSVEAWMVEWVGEPESLIEGPIPSSLEWRYELWVWLLERWSTSMA